MANDRPEMSERPTPRYAWVLRTCVILALAAMATTFVWFQLRSTQNEVTPPQQAERPSTEDEKPAPPTIPPASPEAPTSKNLARAIARATWSSDPQSALLSIPIEPTRGEVKQIDPSRGQVQEFLRIPAYNNDGLKYSYYRITVVAAKRRLWQQTLRAPSVSLTRTAHILDLVMFPSQMSLTDTNDLKVEGRTQNEWRVLGHILLNPVRR